MVSGTLRVRTLKMSPLNTGSTVYIVEHIWHIYKVGAEPNQANPLQYVCPANLGTASTIIILLIIFICFTFFTQYPFIKENIAMEVPRNLHGYRILFFYINNLHLS
jgi:hypothetical protein